MIRDRDSLLNWTVFYALLPGATLLYAGQEIGVRNWPCLFEKDPVDWEHADCEFTLFMEKVLRFAKEIKSACSRVSLAELAEGVVEITWLGEDVAYVALLNLANRYGEINLDELRGGEIYTGEKGERGSYRLESMPVLMKIPRHGRR